MKKSNSFFSKNAQILVLLLISGLYYIQTVSYDFALDDGLMIRDNHLTKQGISGISKILFSDQFVGISGTDKNEFYAGSRYRPLSQIIFAIEYELFGLNAKVFHFFHILFYLSLILVLYKTLTLLFKNQEGSYFSNLPFIISLLYLAHPIHVEVAANIKSLDEILALLLSLGTLYHGLVYHESKKWKDILLGFTYFLLAMLAKENSITFLAVIPLSIWFFRSFQPKVDIQYLAGILIATLAYFFLRYESLGFIMSGHESDLLFHNPFVNVDELTKYAMILYSWGKYLYLLFIPYPLTHDYYPYMIPEVGFTNIYVILSLAIHLALVVFGIIGLRNKKLYGYAIAYYFITFSVVSNLVFNLGILLNERLLFMPSLGFSIIIGSLVYQLFEKYKKALKTKKYFEYGFIAIIVIYGIIVISRNPDWKNDRTLYYADVETSVNSARVNVIAGTLMVLDAKKLPSGKEKTTLYEKAVKYLTRGLKLHADNSSGWQALGDIYYDNKNYVKSYEFYKKAYKYSDNAYTLLNNMQITAKEAMNSGKYDEANSIINNLIEDYPDSSRFVILKAEIIANSKNGKTSIAYLNEKLENFSSNCEFLNLLAEYNIRYNNDFDLSKTYFDQAYKSDSTDTRTLENLGVFYGMNKDYKNSIFYLEKAYKNGGRNNTLIKNMAMTYNILGDTKNFEIFSKMIKD